MYAIYCRPEVADDVISDQNVEALWTTLVWICELLALSIFEKFEINQLYNVYATLGPLYSHFRGQEQNYLKD